ncbi:MAG TPA: beta-ketoacyl synthase chain length factor [Acidisoma sp.]|nr:beta-ketoacyl synthase chain length factor [Acidisoma sp.]
MIRLYIEGIGLRGPGLDGWEASLPIFAGTAAYEKRPIDVPPAGLLPANERRRAPQIVKLALATGAEAFVVSGRLSAETPAIFTSSGGDGETIHAILHTLAGTERELSPTRFHNSVHNVAAGYWSIATGARTPATSLCAHDGSFAAGLIEAGAQVSAGAAAVVLIAYDLPYPGPLAAVRKIAEPFGVACVLAAEPSGQTIGKIDIELSPTAAAPSPASPSALEPLRQSVPAARCLPLLAALAGGQPRDLTLEYLDDLTLTVHVTPGGCP